MPSGVSPLSVAKEGKRSELRTDLTLPIQQGETANGKQCDTAASIVRSEAVPHAYNETMTVQESRQDDSTFAFDDDIKLSKSFSSTLSMYSPIDIL